MAVETTIYNPVHFLNRAILGDSPRFSGDVYLALGELRVGGDGIGFKFAEPDAGQTRKQLIVANRTITWDADFGTYTYLYDEGESFTMFATADWVDVEATAFALFDAATGGNILNYGESGQEPGFPTNGTRFCLRTVRALINGNGQVCGHAFFLSVIEQVYGDGEFLPGAIALDIIDITNADPETETCEYTAHAEPLAIDITNFDLQADLVTFKSIDCLEAPWSRNDMATTLATVTTRRAGLLVDGLLAWHASLGQGDNQHIPDNSDRCHWYTNKGEYEFMIFPGPGYVPV